MKPDTPMPADQIATPKGPLGIEQPFLGFDEWPTMQVQAALEEGDVVILREQSWPLRREAPINPASILYGCLRLKYGWPEGTKVYVEVNSDFAGWKVVRLEMPLD